MKVKYILKIVCDYYEVDMETVLSKSRKREIVIARQIAAYLAMRYLKLTLAYVGKELGNRDHATVIHSMKVVNNLIDTDKKFRHEYEEIEELVSAKINTGTNKKRKHYIVRPYQRKNNSIKVYGR